MHTTIDSQKSKIRTHDHALHHHWPPEVKYSNQRPCTTPPFPQKSKIRTQDHALHHHWPPKVKDSNPWPCTTLPLTPKSQRFEPTTMQYATIDPPKKSDSNPRVLWGSPVTSSVGHRTCRIVKIIARHVTMNGALWLAHILLRYDKATCHIVVLDLATATWGKKSVATILVGHGHGFAIGCITLQANYLALGSWLPLASSNNLIVNA
jgi:hypothetical protein